jgi:hypothetical protein
LSTNNSIINLGDISEPAKVLIEKIANAIGEIYKPYQITRVAQAQAEAKKIEALSKIEINEIQRRALTRFVAEEAKKQDNIEKITQNAIPLLDAMSNPKNMDDDWITNFFDKCRIISDTQMQTIWSKILAGEANSPGTYSKRTVSFLSSASKNEAQLFTELCNFVWYANDFFPLILDFDDSIYHSHGIRFESLSQLDDIGLISFNPVGFINRKLPRFAEIYYQKRSLFIDFKKPEDNTLPLGTVILTI